MQEVFQLILTKEEQEKLDQLQKLRELNKQESSES